MERHLLIDDIRTIYADKTCRTYAEGIESLKEGGWDVLWLDHDLGEEKTGYDIMCFLEENPKYLPGKIVCVSANPVGRKRIEQVIDKIYN